MTASRYLERQTEDHMHIHVYPQQQHIVHGYTILACQKSLLYSLCAVGLSSNSSSDISRFTWEERRDRVTDSQACTYLSVSGYLANSSTLGYMYMEFPGSLVPRLLQDSISQLQALAQHFVKPGNETTESVNVLQPSSSTLVETFTNKLTGNGFESYS